MAYNSNIPQPTDQISQSQADILGNFQALNPLILGQISFPPSGSIPVFPVGTDGLYGKVPALPFPTTGVNEIFLVKSTGASFPLTAQGIFGGVSWCYLPSGLIMKWGSSFNATGTQQFVYPVDNSVPVFTATPTLILLTPKRTHATENAQIYVDAFTAGANTNLQLGVYVTQLNNPANNGNVLFDFLVVGF